MYLNASFDDYSSGILETVSRPTLKSMTFEELKARPFLDLHHNHSRRTPVRLYGSIGDCSTCLTVSAYENDIDTSM